MKNALLVVSTLPKGNSDGYINIGDYIQSLAGKVFFDKIDVYINRERLSQFKSEREKVKMIMNGWFMHSPENWPPSDDIFPLLVAIHISPKSAPKMLSVEGINYLKKYGPVGCRDEYTENLLKQYGVPCYFSGCLTLALGEKYKTQHKKNSVLFVDPYYEYYRNKKGNISIIILLKSFYYGIVNIVKIKKLHRLPFASTKLKILECFLYFFNISAFYKTYSSLFEDDVLINAEYITHHVKVGKNTALVSEEEKLDYAEELLKKYAEASLVVTSRIHCALPCLGLETPILFVTGGRLETSLLNSTRLKGIIKLLRVLRYEKFSLLSDDNAITKENIVNTNIINNDYYIPIRNTLVKTCKEFADFSLL